MSWPLGKHVGSVPVGSALQVCTVQGHGDAASPTFQKLSVESLEVHAETFHKVKALSRAWRWGPLQTGSIGRERLGETQGLNSRLTSNSFSLGSCGGGVAQGLTSASVYLESGSDSQGSFDLTLSLKL